MRFHLSRGAAILACAVSLAGTTAAVVPAPASAHGASTCADRKFTVKPGGGTTLHVPVKSITVEGGIGCTAVYKVIAGVLAGRTPAGWKSVPAKFEAPAGLTPQEVRKGGKKIKYAIQTG